MIYSNRGPLIYPVYAGVPAALTLLLARYPELPYLSRFVAALGGFLVVGARRVTRPFRMALVSGGFAPHCSGRMSPHHGV